MRGTILWLVLLTFGSIAAASDEGLLAAQRGDFAAARAIWTAEATAGDAEAAFNLGWMYQNGDGVGKDLHAAFRWYEMSAEAGLAQAEAQVGFMYGNGVGVKRDIKEAIVWTGKAAKQGHKQSKANLGEMQAYLAAAYFSGNEELGLPANPVKSYMWSVLASENGDSFSESMAEATKSLLSPSDLIQANELVQSCRNSGYASCE